MSKFIVAVLAVSFSVMALACGGGPAVPEAPKAPEAPAAPGVPAAPGAPAAPTPPAAPAVK